MKIITFDEEILVEDKEITFEIAGQKAMGLLKIPEMWRLPFIVIDKTIYQQYCTLDQNKKCEFLHTVQEKIVDLKEQIGVVNENSKIIIRSSGPEEGMKERGKLDSEFGKFSEVAKTLEGLFNSLSKDKTEIIVKYGIPFIVQKYLQNIELGHLSNEIRFVKDKRDWRFEEIIDGELKDSYNVAVRQWRTNYRIEDLIITILSFNSKTEFKDRLRCVAYYFFMNFQERIHLELIWDINRLYIAQIDHEGEDNQDCNDPTKYSINVNNSNALKQLNILREVTEEDSSKFHKIRNLFLYKSVGLKTQPLYILDDKEVLNDISKGKIPLALEEDIRKFLPNSIVIRSDVNNCNQMDKQMLPRSNELRRYDEIEKWLIEKNNQLVNSNNEFVFLFHVFIPARAAAFACAKPNDRIVEIQSLWGLPEGLYYNSHDTFVVDTKSRYADFVNSKQITIKKTPDYKETYIAPDSEGKWTQKGIKKSCSWLQSITDKQIKKIAIESRKIAQKEGRSISVMWFVGIDEKYYGTDCLAWYHEEHDNSTYSYGIYKKKYKTDEELIVRDLNDLETLKVSNNIKIIWINPKEDSILRDKEFLNKVGDIAREKDLTIGIKGSVLAHPLYQLLRKTNKIVLLKEMKSYVDNIEYNKLVRDKIPEIIKENLEEIKFAKATGEVLVRAYLEKLVEELYEIYDSKYDEELYKEFVDVEEICLGLRGALSKVSKINSVFFRNKAIKIEDRLQILESINNEPHNKLLLRKEFLQDVKYNAIRNVDIEWNREPLGILLEIRFSENRHEELEEKSVVDCLLVEEDIIKKMLQISFKMQKENDINQILEDIGCVEQYLLRLKRAARINEEEISIIKAKKIEKVGGFDQGYILIKAGFLDSKVTKKSRTKSKELINLEYLLKEDRVEIKNLEYKSNNYIDFRTGNGKELLIRANFPLSIQKWEYAFKGEKVQRYFGENTILILSCKRIENGDLRLSVFLSRSEKYKQLTL